ncbi:hypothetical protein Ciccas_014633 [Cichlidogyrus casuarinus]|uniref:Uncharacterized protein n=1 Tax=Cichlidogyrus casuarinus TaxID=1844966 RepID=A0ABD2PHX6_9PLAT
MIFSPKRLKTLRFNLAFDNKQIQSIQVSTTSDGNGWHMVNNSGNTKFVDSIIVEYQKMVREFMTENYSTLDKEQAYSILILYAFSFASLPSGGRIAGIPKV